MDDMPGSESEVCYGALSKALAKPSGTQTIMRHAARATQAANFLSTFDIEEQNEGMLSLCFEKTRIAILDVHTISKLMSLRQIPGVRYEAVFDSRIFIKRKSKSSSPFEVSVNILGPRQAADEVSQALSSVDAFLQHPQALSVDVEYYNPDMLVFPGRNRTMNDLIGTALYSSETNQWSQLSLDVSNMLESLSHVVAGYEFGHPDGLVSTLTKHQEEGVRFVLQREDEMFCQKLSEDMRKVTGPGSPTIDVNLLGLGGLIADVMGIGKTLLTLTTILHTAEKAEDFTFFSRPTSFNSDVMLTKATLVIVPNIQLLENWESEIVTHFSENALRHVRFHGPDRPQTAEALMTTNIVITTYATLIADRDGLGLLHRMEWYRIVLDEAHHIRNPTSKQWKAAVALRGRRRWCLSGTPIQNKIEDLGSLAGFLQLPPMSSQKTFEKHILRPLSEPGINSKPLRAYMEAYCLRRSESCLSLPASREVVIPLCLSLPERQAYDAVLDQARKQIDDMVSAGSNVRCTKLFTALLRMRMICNTGTYRSTQGPSDSLTTQSYAKQSYNWQQHCERCSPLNGDSLVLLSTCEVCPDCMRPLHQRSPSPLPSPASPLSLNYESVSGNGSEFSTKLEAVVQMLIRASDSKDKAIVFSYWKTTLHILTHLLRTAGVAYVQVDGDTSFADRSSRLRAFKEDPAILVLLMTVETGAVGLNLTVANQVHIVEPQWNPSVEEQAVARAVRMGQKREVTIYRYVLQNTVEQNVVKLQEKKRRLAKYTLGLKADQSISDAVQELESVLELNPRKRALESC